MNSVRSNRKFCKSGDFQEKMVEREFYVLIKHYFMKGQSSQELMNSLIKNMVNLLFRLKRVIRGLKHK